MVFNVSGLGKRAMRCPKTQFRPSRTRTLEINRLGLVLSFILLNRDG